MGLDVGDEPASAPRNGFAPNDEAEATVLEMLGTAEVGTEGSTTGVTVGAYFAEWIENMRYQVRATTWHGMLATTGMRRGELFGLRWSDVDLDRGRLPIAQSLLNIDSHLVIEPTKSNRSRRSVALDPGTVEVLRAHKRRQAEERLAFGEQWEASYHLVFCKPNGEPEHPDMLSRRFKTKAKAAGLPTLRGPHNLRHTWATLALKAGVHPQTVSDRLGHATIAITIDTYSHVTPSMDADAADLVAASILGGGKAAR